MSNLLTPEKTEEIRLQAFLGSAYQRLFVLRGEIGRMEAELESYHRLPDGENVPDNPLSDAAKEYMEMTIKRFYVVSLIGKAKNEMELLETQIKGQTQTS
jgi:hypothetical protein